MAKRGRDLTAVIVERDAEPIVVAEPLRLRVEILHGQKQLKLGGVYVRIELRASDVGGRKAVAPKSPDSVVGRLATVGGPDSNPMALIG